MTWPDGSPAAHAVLQFFVTRDYGPKSTPVTDGNSYYTLQGISGLPNLYAEMQNISDLQQNPIEGTATWQQAEAYLAQHPNQLVGTSRTSKEQALPISARTGDVGWRGEVLDATRRRAVATSPRERARL